MFKYYLKFYEFNLIIIKTYNLIYRWIDEIKYLQKFIKPTRLEILL